MARLIQGIVAKNNLMKHTIVVTNKSGGAGAEGFLAVKEVKGDPHRIVRWMSVARPREFARLAPLVVRNANQSDPAGCELMRLAGAHIDTLAERLGAIGAGRWALAGGLSSGIGAWLSPQTRRRLVPAAADALTGAVWLARAEVGLPMLVS